ncbi:TonB-dependent receptor [Altericroceibacterium endophyticum]|uniref:TonB-dependent receptor n=1 Tax=Altericroceibacterium endophyticum TaxID=1808508 RepID=A0A6I4T845_9SPHN|nr:TonB-dependent receptor [Altericroceibacterium endophyticum]MXO66848.1 TonB-dependent receptor [Altericroceibacterium endophyticum]
MIYRVRAYHLRASAFLAASSALALGFATPALAQDASDTAAESSSTTAQNFGSNEIVVTAQFREQNLQDTPIAITAVTADTLEARSQESVTDLGNYAPNVSLSQASGIQGNSVAAFIRGIGQSDSSFALEPGVGVYIDDIYYGTTFGAVMDLTDLERVEVLRGPQGTLSGKNSVGGAVKLYTSEPDGTGGGFVEAKYGSYNRIDLRASAEFTIADGLYARISGVSKTADGFFDRLDYGCLNPGSGFPTTGTGTDGCKLGTEGGQDMQATRLALRYAPYGSPLEINVRADYSTNNSEAPATKLVYADNPNVRSYVEGDPTAGVPFDSRFITGPKSYSSYSTYAAGGNYTTNFGFPAQFAPGTFQASPTSSVESWGVSGKIDYELADNLSLTSITGYRVADGTSGIDYDGSPIALIQAEFGYRHEQFTQELRLSAQLADGLIDTTVGGFYYDAKDRINGRQHIPTSMLNFIQDDKVTNRSASVFGHLEVHATDRLDLVGGLRYTDDKKTYNFGRSNLDGTPPAPTDPTNFILVGLNGQKDTFSGDQIDYRVGLNYDLTDDVMVYAQVSTGFKGGGVNPTPYVPDQVQTFGPEKITTYEGGFKSRFLDRAVTLNGAVFLNDYSDIQLVRYQCPTSAVPACSIPSNAGDAEIFGFELETVIEPARGFSIDGSLGYLDFDYTEITNPATMVTMDMVAPYISKWQASAGVQYAAMFKSGATLTPRVDWSYRSSFNTNSINSDYNKIDGYSLFNARLTFETADSNWSISGAVTNVFDKFYYVALAENVNSYGVVTGNPGRPREWSLTVRREF